MNEKMTVDVYVTFHVHSEKKKKQKNFKFCQDAEIKKY